MAGWLSTVLGEGSKGRALPRHSTESEDSFRCIPQAPPCFHRTAPPSRVSRQRLQTSHSGRGCASALVPSSLTEKVQPKWVPFHDAPSYQSDREAAWKSSSGFAVVQPEALVQSGLSDRPAGDPPLSSSLPTVAPGHQPSPPSPSPSPPLDSVGAHGSCLVVRCLRVHSLLF